MSPTRPWRDEEPARAPLGPGPEADAAAAMHALGVAARATIDVYRSLHPSGQETTFSKSSGESPTDKEPRRRLDTIRVGREMMHMDGARPRVVAVEHVPRRFHEVVLTTGKQSSLKKFDHQSVAITYRVSDVPHERGFTFPSELLKDEARTAALAKAMTESLCTGEEPAQARIAVAAGGRVVLDLVARVRTPAAHLQKHMQEVMCEVSEDAKKAVWLKERKARMNAGAKVQKLLADAHLVQEDENKKKSLERQIAKAKQDEAVAVGRVQRLKLARRVDERELEYWDEREAVQRALAQRTHAEVVTAMTRGGGEILETTPEGIHRVARGLGAGLQREAEHIRGGVCGRGACGHRERPGGTPAREPRGSDHD